MEIKGSLIVKVQTDDLIIELGTFSSLTQGIHPGGTEGPDCMPAFRLLCP